MSPRRRWKRWPALLLLATWPLLAAPVPVGGQESLAVGRLQQELDRLRTQTRFELETLQREVDRLRDRVRQLEGRRAIAPPPPESPRAGADRAGADAGAGVVDELQARRLVLHDGSGRTRAVLHGGAEGGPTLALLDASGTVRAILALEDGRPSLELVDGRGLARLRMEVGPEHAALTVRDRDGRPVARLGDPGPGSEEGSARWP